MSTHTVTNQVPSRVDLNEFDTNHALVRAVEQFDAADYLGRTSAWAAPRPGANVPRAAAFMLFSEIEPGHGCSVSMTHAAVPALAASPQPADEWMPRLLSRHYDGALAAG